MFVTARLHTTLVVCAVTVAGTALAAVPSVAGASPASPAARSVTSVQPAPVGLLLPAVQAAREAARR